MNDTIAELKKIRGSLGSSGASQQAAKKILKTLTQKY
ncbi:MAG: hypothetical protein ACI8Q2_000460 [Candidatus Omnitrophota bacterium]|jgi:hypothetical protein